MHDYPIIFSHQTYHKLVFKTRTIFFPNFRLAFVEANILSVITDWLAPLPRDKSLPSLPLREILLQFLYDVPIDDYSRLKESGVGKAVMYMYR